MGKTVVNFARKGSGFAIPVHCLVLIGRDTTHVRGEHTNYQERALYQATDEDVAGIIVMGSSVESVKFCMEEVPVERFKPDFLRRAISTWKRDCAIGGRAWEEPDRWPVVADGRHKTISGRAAEEHLNDGFFYLVGSNHKLDEAEKVGVQAGSNAHQHVYTPIQRALDYIEFAKRNPSPDAARAYFNCSDSTLANYAKVADLDPEVIAAVLNDTVPFVKALKWAKLAPSKQREALAAFLAPKPASDTTDAPNATTAPTKREARALADGIIAGKYAKVPREVGFALRCVLGGGSLDEYPELADAIATMRSSQPTPTETK